MSTQDNPKADPSAAKAKPRAQKSERPAIGNYVIEPTSIDATARQAIAAKLQAAELPSVDVFPAKENGTYKGAVVLADKDWIVQSVGKDHSAAVAHRREDVTIQGASLLGRDANNDLEGRNIQIFYRGDKAKAYPWNAEQERANRTENRTDAAREAAAAYAKETMRSPKQREAFVKHVEGMFKAWQQKDADKGKADFSKARAVSEKSTPQAAERSTER